MSALDSKPVKKVRQALLAAGLEDTVVELDESARTAAEAAEALNVEPGAIVKSLVFLIGETPVMALMAGDRQCKADALPRVLALDAAAAEAGGEVRAGTADEVRAATGFAIGGVPPVGLASEMPVAIDVGLKRFETVYAAAGHPNCVFATSVSELKQLTGCIVSYAIAEPA